MFRSVALPALLTLLLAGCQTPVTSHQQIPPNTAPVAVCGSGDVMMQTTLWFGMNKPKGGTVSNLEWQQFVDNDVTPRFKDGLSVYDAKGQWLGDNGKLARENSKALMLIHNADRSSSDSINGLREVYKKRFEQESVMRVDSLVCVAF
ncbi:DUF3574 domain-containing protein [Candidatus Pantoea floridensis]|uniref:DUF3574 domain-containing protein n=1 Tax=Candidatus Pantoea floridensis TaxID=1938870 RepID=A0A286BTU4_9GAMM|nr:DUF3574 domain-containing protein [Pantoea floridensis]PIF24085.1 uncharacterized protein DUF3574 [Enterobacteriaceae bacterium JKS000233]SOD37538.1 Protein of unknown function [Pantoea floridensis]HBZ16787.1 DUF3574 domain-containing protein [Pantoea sp.]